MDMKKVALAPSLLSADFSDLAGAVKKIASSPASIVHIDVMDGCFVPEISYGQPVVKSLRPLTELPFDVHLMVQQPERMVDSFAAAGADWLTFHLESTTHANRLARHIRGMGKKAGVSIVPSTPVCLLSELVEEVDVVLVMAVNPGFGGQSLIPSCLGKVRELCRLRAERGLDFLVSVDGGVNNATVAPVVASGADVVVSGSAFFNGDFAWNY